MTPRVRERVACERSSCACALTWSRLPNASSESIFTGSTVTPSFIRASEDGAESSSSWRCVRTGLGASLQSDGYATRYANSESTRSASPEAADAKEGASSRPAPPPSACSSACRRGSSVAMGGPANRDPLAIHVGGAGACTIARETTTGGTSRSDAIKKAASRLAARALAFTFTLSSSCARPQWLPRGC